MQLERPPGRAGEALRRVRSTSSAYYTRSPFSRLWCNMQRDALDDDKSRRLLEMERIASKIASTIGVRG